MDKKKAVKVAKVVGGTMASIAVGTLVTVVIKNNTIGDHTKMTKACIWAGGFILGGMVSSKAALYVEETIDDLVEQTEEVINE